MVPSWAAKKTHNSLHIIALFYLPYFGMLQPSKDLTQRNPVKILHNLYYGAMIVLARFQEHTTLVEDPWNL